MVEYLLCTEYIGDILLVILTRFYSACRTLIIFFLSPYCLVHCPCRLVNIYQSIFIIKISEKRFFSSDFSFLCRIDIHILKLLYRPLTCRVEAFHSIYLVIPQLYSYRIFLSQRKNIQYSASY